MASTWKTGDVVELKSGGPSMTVIDPDAPGGVLCKWFNKERAAVTDIFPAESLRERKGPTGSRH